MKDSNIAQAVELNLVHQHGWVFHVFTWKDGRRIELGNRLEVNPDDGDIAALPYDRKARQLGEQRRQELEGQQFPKEAILREERDGYALALGSIQSAVAEALDLDRTPTTAQEVKEAIKAKLSKTKKD